MTTKFDYHKIILDTLKDKNLSYTHINFGSNVLAEW
jgi:hypothetical protein